jgi:hypothetical protein
LLWVLSFAHSVSAAPPAACEGIKDGLIACYPFDGNTNDLSGKNYHGVAKNITYVAGQMGQAAHFDGKTSYVEIANNPDLNSQQVSFSAWVKPEVVLNSQTNLYNHHIIFNKEYQYELAIFNRPAENNLQAGELSFSITSNWGWITTGYFPTSNKFVHVALVFTKEKIAKLYMDGKVVKEEKYSSSLDVSHNLCMRIGARHCPDLADYFFNGDMDEFRIYNRELSETEVKQLAGVAEPVPPVPSTANLCNLVPDNLVACYPFNGDTNDYSGNNNHAKILQVEPNALIALTEDRNNFPNSAYKFVGGNVNKIGTSLKDTNFSITNAMTISTWFKTTAHANFDGIVNLHSRIDQISCCQYRMMLDPNSHPFYDAGDHVDQTVNNFTFKSDTWYHYAMVVRGDGAAEIYVNGELISKSDAGVPKTLPDGRFLFIGTDGFLEKAKRDPHVFEGIVDDMLIYRKALSADEIKRLYNAPPDQTAQKVEKVASCEGVKDGLVACYSFDGNSNDLSGKNYHGVPKSLSYTQGKIGQAAHFDGKSSYVEIANNPDLNSQQTSFSAWVKPVIEPNPQAEPFDHRVIFSKELQHFLALFTMQKPQYEYGVYSIAKTNAGELSFAMGSQWAFAPSDYFPVSNKFIHIVLVYTKDNVAKLYIDGKLVKEHKYPKPIPVNNNCLRIGARGFCSQAANYFFNGDIDEFRIYNRELSETEIQQLASVNTGGIESKPVEPPVVKYTVSVTKTGDGKGEVQAEDLGLKCGAVCQYDYPSGSKVKLLAFPLQKHYLKEWTGDCSGTDQNVTITVDKAKNCTAVFMPEQAPPPPPPAVFNVVITKTGMGDVKTADNSIDCGATCQHGYTANSTVGLVAVPAAGYTFKEWSGDCTGNIPAILLTVDKAKNCAATFAQQQAAPVPNAPSQLCMALTGTYGQDRVGYCNDYTFEGNNLPCVIHKGGEIIADECAQAQLMPKPLANKVLSYAKHAFVSKNFSATTPRCDGSVEFSAENKTKAPANMAFVCVRYEQAAGTNSFYYGLAFVNDAQILSYKFETTPDRCIGNCPK